MALFMDKDIWLRQKDLWNGICIRSELTRIMHAMFKDEVH